MSQFPTLTRGGVGRVRFQDFNRLFEAADEVLGAPERDAAAGRLATRSLWASLTAQETVGGQACWTFAQVGKQAGPAVGTDPSLLSTSKFAPENGRAIDLAGSAAAGDVVLLHEIVSVDGRRWFAFAKAAAPAVAIVNIIGNVVVSTNKWKYSGKIGTLDVRVLNLFEDAPFGRGQQLVSPGNGTLTPQPLPSTTTFVIGLRDGTLDGFPLYKCDTANALLPACT